MKCEVCQGEMGATYVDGKMRIGPWAAMCHRCHKAHGTGLGLWRGQKFVTKTGEKVTT